MPSLWPTPPVRAALLGLRLGLPGLLLGLGGCLLEDDLEDVDKPADADGDGFNEDVDCNDLHPAIHPDADEICDGDPQTGEGEVDNNCNGLRGDDDPTLNVAVVAGTWYRDADGDGYGDASGAIGTSFSGCVKPEGYVEVGEDCDDSNSSVQPDSREICGDSIDNDCDGDVDVVDPNVDAGAAAAPVWFLDADEDGYGDEDSSRASCARPAPPTDGGQWVAPRLGPDDPRIDDWSSGSINIEELPSDAFDCDDNDASTNPGELEDCGDLDRDCDGDAYFGAPDGTAWFRDVDGDGVGDPEAVLVACTQPSGYKSPDEGEDCDDTNFSIKPAEPDPGGLACDGLDNDCDGEADNGTDGSGLTYTWCKDSDLDGFPNAGQCVEAFCQPDRGAVEQYYISVADVFPGESSSVWNDCDDTSAFVSPGADEYCDAIDNNCDGFVDETPAADASTWYTDQDGDGYGDPAASTVQACVVPSGYAGNADDCDDNAANVNPTAAEVCNTGIAEDCVASVDDCLMDGGYSGRLDEVGEGDGIVGYPWAALTGPSAAAAAGAHVARGGDLDNDGEEELLVYAPFSGNGKVFIVRSAAAVEGATLLSTLETGPTITGTGTTALGFNVSAADDLLGVSAHSYLVVGAPGAAGGGAVAVFDGAVLSAAGGDHGTASAGLVLSGTGATTGFGGIADALDFDGDGTGDLLVGDAVATTTGVSAGGEGLHLVLGPLSDDGATSLASFSNTVELSGAVYAASSAGDIDNDGADDLVWIDSAGIGLTLGGGTADCALATSCADARLAIDGSFSTWSSQPVVLRALGDLNGDGYADVGAGVPYADAVASGDEGEVSVWLGTATGWTGSISLSFGFIGADDNAHAGAALDGGVDLDGDGRHDLVLGSPGDDGITGAAYVFYGGEAAEGATYSVYTARTYVTGDSRGATGFGRSVALSPGVLNDGTADLAVGAPLLSGGAGGVFLFGQRE